MIRVVLIDDEMPALSELAFIIEESGIAKVIGKFTEPVEGLLFIQNEEPDLVFLDIDMPQMSGLKLAEAIRGMKTKTAVVFATAYEGHALEAFEKDAIDYLLKPYEEERVFRALRKVMQSATQDQSKENSVEKEPEASRLPITLEDRIVFVNVSDIIFCKVEDAIVYIQTEEQEYKMSETLSKLEEKLPKRQFFKTHRAYVVNLDKVKQVSPYFNHTLMLQLEGSSEEVPVSRSHVKAFKKKLNI